MHHHAHRLERHQVLEVGLDGLDAEAGVLEAGGRVELAARGLHCVVGVRGDLAQGGQGVPGQEGAGVDHPVAGLAVRVDLQCHGAVGAHRVAVLDAGGAHDRQGRADGAAGRDDHRVLLGGVLQGGPHRGGHGAVVVHQGAVHVQADQQLLPGQGAQRAGEAGDGGAALRGGVDDGGGCGRGGTHGAQSAATP